MNTDRITTSSALQPDKQYGSVRLSNPDNGILEITLERPEVRNAIDKSLFDGLVSALLDVERDEASSVVLISGSGSGFCAGADLSSGSDLRAITQQTDRHGGLTFDAELFLRRVVEPVRILNRLQHVTVAVVDGPAYGAGFGLAMACDLRLISERAAFAASAINMGLSHDFGLSKSLAKCVGYPRALELLVTGRTVRAKEAQLIGIAQSLTPTPRLSAMALSRDICGIPSHSVRTVKASMVNAMQASFEDVLDDVEPRALASIVAKGEFLTVLSRHSAKFE